MLQPHQIEELISVVSSMGRSAITERLMEFDGAFPVDFTPEFLDRQSIERLRHLFVALCMQNGHFPHELIAA
jgi:hypothetical protein